MTNDEESGNEREAIAREIFDEGDECHEEEEENHPDLALAE